jgi:hypothetical protein
LEIPASQHYLYLKKLFPLCRLEVAVDEHNNIIEIAATNSAWKMDHPLPPLSVLRMRSERMRPLSDKSRIVIATNSDELILHPAAGAAAINAFNELLQR